MLTPHKYLKGNPDLGSTFYTILHAKCDAAFCVHPKTGGSQFSVSFSIGETPTPFFGPLPL
jgi:hypothetical protein